MHPTTRARRKERTVTSKTHLHPATIEARKKMLEEREQGNKNYTPDRICNTTMVLSYDGAELRDFDGRPGAMDAFRIPSGPRLS